MHHIVALLKEYGAHVLSHANQYLQSCPPSPYLHDLIIDYPNRGGKMMRPGICISTARAFGAELEETIPFATSIELLHNALLIHDDIQDESEERRGRPTLHALHGVPLAINAGDTLLMLALGPLFQRCQQYGSRVGQLILEFTLRMAQETAEGQALDIGWRRDNRLDINVADYLQMVLKKTAWMSTIWPAQIGVLIGGKGRANPESVTKFGFFLGACFQIQDDLLNLIPNNGYGKEAMGDLYEGKKTLMLIHLRQNSSRDEVAEIDRILRAPRTNKSEADVSWLFHQMERKGSIVYARTVAEALTGAALHEFSLAFAHLPASADKDFMQSLPLWILNK
jgi:geranylgeranyl diphosphate synthase type II